jgi:electron transfer flavoprotein alpha/beta subunit
MGIKRAKTKDVKQLAAADLVPATPPVVVLAQISLPAKKKSTQIISGSPKEAATTLVEKLRTEAHVL